MATNHSQIQALVAILYYFHLPFCICNAQVAILLFSFPFCICSFLTKFKWNHLKHIRHFMNNNFLKNSMELMYKQVEMWINTHKTNTHFMNLNAQNLSKLQDSL